MERFPDQEQPTTSGSGNTTELQMDEGGSINPGGVGDEIVSVLSAIVSNAPPLPPLPLLPPGYEYVYNYEFVLQEIPDSEEDPPPLRRRSWRRLNNDVQEEPVFSFSLSEDEDQVQRVFSDSDDEDYSPPEFAEEYSPAPLDDEDEDEGTKMINGDELEEEGTIMLDDEEEEDDDDVQIINQVSTSQQRRRSPRFSARRNAIADEGNEVPELELGSNEDDVDTEEEEERITNAAIQAQQRRLADLTATVAVLTDEYLRDAAIPSTSSASSSNNTVQPIQQQHQPATQSTSSTSTSSAVEDTEDESTTCLICYEPYTNSGPHRLTCLRCGHTYGKSCIEKWIRAESRCPQCNTKATRKDIRIIYVKNLKVLDTAERDRAVQELEKEKEAKRRLELECIKLKQRYTMQEEEVKRMRLEYGQMKRKVGGIYMEENSNSAAATNNIPTTSSAGSSNLTYTPLKQIPFVSGTESRIGLYNNWLNMVAITVSTKSPLYPHGLHSIKRINLLDFSTSNMPMQHTREIRDLGISPTQSDTLLSVSLDKHCLLTNCNSNITIQNYTSDYPLWSCCWNTLNQYQFYTGSGNGYITTFDIRKPNQSLSSFVIPGDEGGPIVRLIYVNPSYTTIGNKFNLHGLIVLKLNSIWFVEISTRGENVYHQLPFEGPFLSTSFEEKSRHLLLSTRAKTGGKHLVMDLVESHDADLGRGVVGGNVVQEWPNAISLSKLTRTAIYNNGLEQPKYKVLVAANTLRSTVSIWSLNDTNWKQTLNLQEPALDFIPCNLNGNHLLGVLESQGIGFWKGVGE